MSFVLLPFRQIDATYTVSAILVITAALGTAQQACGQTKTYIVTDLSGDDASQVPCKLNNFGDVVGRKGSAVEGEPLATVWNRSRSNLKNPGALLGGDYSSAFGINDAGEVAGVSNTGNAIVPLVWTATGGLRRIPLLPGDSCGQAIGINKYGHVAGYSSGPNGARAFVWTRKMGVRNLGVLPGDNYSRARDLNDSSEVVGTSASTSGERAVLWTKTGNVRDLGTLPGDWASEATAINNAGDVVGYSKGPRGLRAFLWTNGTGMQELGVLSGGNSSRALDINDRGAVVGSSTSSSGDRAFIWTRQTGIVDLNRANYADVGLVFIEAEAINYKGDILVMGKMMHEIASPDGGQQCAPAPPSSFVLTSIASR